MRAEGPVPAPGLSWCVEEGGVTILPQDGPEAFLPYPEAALWDFVARNLPAERVVRMLRAISGECEMEKFVGRTLGAWIERGWLVEEGAWPTSR
jgi:hypothetical protein